VQKTVKKQRKSSAGEQVRASQPQRNSESIPAQLQSTNGHSLSTRPSSINLDVWTLTLKPQTVFNKCVRCQLNAV